MSKKILVMLLMLTLVAGANLSAAQDNAEGSAYLILLNYTSVPSIDVYLDGKLLADQQDQWVTSEQIEVAAGSHTLTIATNGVQPADMLTTPSNVSFRPGMVNLIWATSSDHSTDFSVDALDLGKPSAAGDVAPGRVAFFNLMQATDTMNLVIDGTQTVVGKPSVESPIENLSTDSFRGWKVVDANTGSELAGYEVGASDPPIPSVPNAIHTLMMRGAYPGVDGTDYFWFPELVYIGVITKNDSGTIQVGDTVQMDLKVGERSDYTLTLDAATSVNVLLAGETTQQDAFLRIYDADGKRVVQNDDLDSSDSVYDAGVIGLRLNPGTYTIEAASIVDVVPGAYTLSIKPGGA